MSVRVSKPRASFDIQCELFSFCELPERFLVRSSADKCIRLRVDEKRHATASPFVVLLKFGGILFIIPRLFLLNLDSLRDEFVNYRHHLDAVRTGFAVEFDEHSFTGYELLVMIFLILSYESHPCHSHHLHSRRTSDFSKPCSRVEQLSCSGRHRCT